MDIVTVPESRCSPAQAFYLRKAIGWKAIGSLHRAPMRRGGPTVGGFPGYHGGCTALNLRPWATAMTQLRKDSDYQAWVSFEVSQPDGTPFAVVSAYIPCAGSAEYKTEGYVDRVIASIEAEYMRLKPMYPFGVMFKGDTNHRYGRKGRRTEDEEVEERYTRKLRAMFDRLGIAPLAGRPGQPGAVMTSRSPNGCAHTDPSRPFLGLTEVDYIAGPRWWGPEHFTVHEAQPWEDAPKGATHRMIYVTVHPPPKPGHRANVDRAVPGRRRGLRVPTYDNIKAWDAGAKVLLAFLSKHENRGLLLPGLANGTGAERVEKIRRLFELVAEAGDPEGVALRAELDRGGTRLIRRDARRFKGYNLPRHLVHAFARARRLRAEATKRLGRFRLAQAPAEIQAAVAELKAKAERISKAACREADAAVEDRLREAQKSAEHMRVHDPQALYELLRGICPEDGVDAEDHGDANKIPEDLVSTFEAFYKAQFTAGGAPVDGPADPSWPIPRGPGAVLAMVFTALELYHRFYPAMQSIAIPPCVGGGPNCTVCAQRRAQHAALVAQGWDTDRPDAVEVDCSPCLSTNSCGGKDGLNPKHVRWVRTADRGGRRELRTKVVTAMAHMYNVWLFEEGRVPDSVAQCRTILLRKVDKKGAKLPARDPSSYRGITMSGVFAKGLSMALTHRLQHWAVAHGLISPEQIGFMPMKGAEDHVVTLLDTVRHYWSKKPKTRLCAVFIDFKKAYDRVNPAAMWHVLRTMGVPAVLVDFLAAWSSQRVTTLAINGRDSEPWPMTMGLAQGDPMSPLLFNFFLESLIRAVKQDEAIHGVTVDAPAHGQRPARRFSYKLLVYADDIVLVCESPAQAQLAVHAVQRWAEAWGMELGIGEGKTEAMMFKAPGAAAEQPPAPLTIPGRPDIQWTQEYKYLGYILRPDLDTTGLVQHAVGNIHNAWKRYFYGNSTMRTVSPVLALQVFRSCVLGAANYLLGIIEPTADVATYMDTHTRAVTREVLHAYKRTPTSLLWAEGHLPMATTVMTRERLRLFLKLQHTPFPDSIFAQVMGIVKQNAEIERHRYPRPHKRASWVIRTQHILAQHHATHGVVPGVPVAAWDCSRVAAVYARAVGVMTWQSQAASSMTKAGKPIDAARDFDASAADGTKEVAASFFALGYRTTAARLGTYKSTTPLSARGPGCSGSILTSVSRRLSRPAMAVLMGVRTGREGWHRVGSGGFNAAEYAADVPRPCHLCHGMGDEGPYHACCVCPHGDVDEVRAKVIRTLPNLIYHLVRLGYQSIEPKDGDGLAAALIAEAAQHLAEHQDWTTAEGRFIMFRLLSLTPWPAALPEAAAGPLTALLGRMFDAANAKSHRIRPLCNMWATWAQKWLLRLHSAYYGQRPAPAAAACDAAD